MITQLKEAGDTIVEVLIAVACLALVLGIAYNIAVKSAGNTEVTQERSEALQLAQSQIEFLRENGATNDLIDFNGTDKCFSTTGATFGTAVSSPCTYQNGTGEVYLINITEASAQNGELYTVSVSWDLQTSNTYKYDVKLYYEI